jgi:LCP family protein required for cell wall assembly
VASDSTSDGRVSEPLGHVPSGEAQVGAVARGSDVALGAIVGVRVVAALLSVAVLLGSGWAWSTYRSFSSGITHVNPFAAGSKSSAHDIDGQDQNILIVGNDDRDSATDAELRQLGTTRDGGSYNTDTMMLLHVPADGSKATVISFPRDSYVAIPGHGMNKLNAAYPIGISTHNGDKNAGAQLLVSTIEQLTDLTIDHYAQVDLLGFYRISNAIGGVTVCLNNAVKEPNSGIDLKKGDNVIKGTQALAFVRQRYGFPDGQGDLDRIKRQQYFLSAVFRQITSAGILLNPLKLQKLLRAVTSSLTIDSSLDPLSFAKQMQNLQAGNVKFTTIPTDGFSNEQIDGQTESTVVVNAAGMPAFVDSVIGIDPLAAFKAAKAAAPSMVTVNVVNDTNSDGLETTNAAALRAAGFTVSVPAATDAVLAKTTIRYPKGMESQAKAVQAQLPQAVIEPSSAVKVVTVLLGNNGVQVKSLMARVGSPSPGTGSSAANTPAPSTSVPKVTTAADAGCID